MIFGSADIAELPYYYFSRDTEYNPGAFTVDRDYVADGKLGGLLLVPFDEVEKDFPPETHSMFIALSNAQLNRLRRQ